MRRALLAAVAVGVAAAIAVVVLVTRPERRPPPRPHAFLVGLDDDTVKWYPPRLPTWRYRDLGVDLVRMWIPWHGEARPRGAVSTYVARAESLARTGPGVVLAVFGFARDAPLRLRAQARYCDFVVRVLRRAPAVRAVVIWNEANGPLYWPQRAGAAAYARLLARCWDTVHATRPGVTVLDSTSSHHDPEAFLIALGRAYRASGRVRPLVDAFGHNPYPLGSAEPPWRRHARGAITEADYPRLVRVLRHAFAGTAQRLGGRHIWYLEDGFQSSVASGRRRFYHGRETERRVVPPELEASRLRDALLLASCQPQVRAFLNFELVDENRLAGWQSGLVWRGGGRKPAYAFFRRAIRAVRDGRVRCGRVRGT